MTQKKVTRVMTLTMAMAIGGCHMHHNKTETNPSASPSTMPTTAPASAGQTATTATPAANKVPGVAPAPLPFIAMPVNPLNGPVQPSVLLLAHARSDSPVPLSEYAKQPVRELKQFKLKADLSAAEVEHQMGPPAQLADYTDPWFVYRLTDNRELWLQFDQPDKTHLVSADVVREVEDGYIRNRVFSASDVR